MEVRIGKRRTSTSQQVRSEAFRSTQRCTARCSGLCSGLLTPPNQHWLGFRWTPQLLHPQRWTRPSKTVFSPSKSLIFRPFPHSWVCFWLFLTTFLFSSSTRVVQNHKVRTFEPKAQLMDPCEQRADYPHIPALLTRLLPASHLSAAVSYLTPSPVNPITPRPDWPRMLKGERWGNAPRIGMAGRVLLTHKVTGGGAIRAFHCSCLCKCQWSVLVFHRVLFLAPSTYSFSVNSQRTSYNTTT